MNPKLAGLSLLVIGATFLAPNYADAQIFRPRHPNYPQQQAPVPEKPTRPSYPVVQIYDTKVIIDDNNKRVFQNYWQADETTRYTVQDKRHSSIWSGCLFAGYVNSADCPQSCFWR